MNSGSNPQSAYSNGAASSNQNGFPLNFFQQGGGGSWTTAEAPMMPGGQGQPYFQDFQNAPLLQGMTGYFGGPADSTLGASQQGQMYGTPFLGSTSASAQPMGAFIHANGQGMHSYGGSSQTTGPSGPTPAPGQHSHYKSDDTDDEQKDASSGPVRSKASTAEQREKAAKAPIAAPVKAACTFCRSRKSRCDGKQPCATCIAREKVDDCIYTVSRRGGKPKPKKLANPEVLENHLRHLAMLSELPHTVRIPTNISHIPNMQDFSTIFPAGRPADTSLSERPQAPPQAPSANNRPHGQLAGTFDVGAGNTFSLGADGGAALAAWPQALPDAVMASVYPPTGADLTGDNAVSKLATEPAAADGKVQASPAQTGSGHTSSVLKSGWSETSLIPTTDTRTLLEDYYKYLHRFLPVLPSPVYIDALTSLWDPQSPFLLALQALLPLLRHEIQPANPLHDRLAGGLNFGDEAKKSRVRTITTHFEKLANEAVDRAVESADGDAKGKVALEVIQALCVLTIFDYGHGRTVKARLKADQALGLAMAEGLHRLRSSSLNQGAATSETYFGDVKLPESEVYEMKKRCWWTVWSFILWSAYNTGNTSTLRADDPRITCEMPQCADPTAWISNIRSLQTLLAVQERVIALSNLNSIDSDEAQEASPKAVSSPMSSRAPHTPISLQSFSVGSPLTGQAGSSGAPPSEASRNSLFNSMLELDHQLEEQIEMQESCLSAVRNGRQVEAFAGLPTSVEHAEDALIAYLHTSAAIQLYTSSLTLHIGQAFKGASVFERKLCFLNPNKGDAAPACREPVPSTYLTELAGQASDANATHASTVKPEEDTTLGDIFNPFSWMTQSFDDNPTDAFATALSKSTRQPTDQAQHIHDAARSESSASSKAGARKVKKRLFTGGPFSAQHSLSRCVRASIRLLEIASNKRLEPNPFNACSFVLISYVLLMLAMSRGVEDAAEDDDEDGDGEQGHGQSGPKATNNEPLLQLAGMSTDGSFSSPSLQQIWNRVQQARDSLAALSEIWEGVTPMVWEINSCLETSRTLFAQAEQ